MKRIYNFILLVCLVQLAVAQNRIAEIRENLLGNYSDRVLVVSHRADWRNAPENSLQGIRNCIDMGVDMVEIDLKKTKDGHLVVMHDKTINRTMTGKGNAEDYTLAELKAMRLKNGAGCKTRHQIPTLEEVMLLCKGKIMVNIDKGYDYFQEAYAVLDKVIFMPIVNLHKEGAEKIINDYQSHMKPAAYELVFNDDNEEMLRLIRKVRDSGAKLFINSLWPELCGGHDDDRAVELHQPDESWGWILNQGAKLIQTDRPALLLEYLRKKKLHD